MQIKLSHFRKSNQFVIKRKLENQGGLLKKYYDHQPINKKKKCLQIICIKYLISYDHVQKTPQETSQKGIQCMQIPNL